MSSAEAMPMHHLGESRGGDLCAKAAPRRILVVDDDEPSRRALAMLYKMEGFEVATAADGIDALDRLHGWERCAVIVSDIEMPRMDGLELLARVRAAFGIPVVLMTALDRQSVPWPSDARPEGFMATPIDFERALATVLGVLAQGGVAEPSLVGR